mgnify:FL=1
MQQIEVCLRCSAKLNHGITTIFERAREAVLYPWRPLFDPTERVRSLAVVQCVCHGVADSLVLVSWCS